MKKNSIATGIVHLWDMPANLVYVGLNREFEIKMLADLKRSYKYLIYVAKLTNKHEQMLYNIGRNRKIRLDFLWDICSLLLKKGYNEYSKKNIEKNICVLGTKRGDAYIYNPKLPFNFNSDEGACFVSAILFDGGIDREKKPHYGNIHFFMRNRIKNCAVSLFGKMCHKELNPRRGFFIRFPSIVGILLNSCFNVGVGKKVYANNKIPKFIFKLTERSKCAFIRQAFDDDGWISKNKYTIAISETMGVTKEKYNVHRPRLNLINDLKKLMEEVGITTNGPSIGKKYILQTEHRKKGPFYRQCWKLSITGRNNIEKYYKKIGFNLKYKQNRLEQLINSYVVTQRRKMEIYNDAIKKCEELQEQKGYFTANDLAKGLDITYRYAARIIQKMLIRKIVKIILKKQYSGFGSTQTGYILIKYH